MTTTVTFKGKSGNDVNGELAEPGGAGKAPSVVLIQEWWGINDHIKSLAERLAKEGFLVVAPDLYHGKVAKDASEAMTLMTELDTLAAMKDVAGAVTYLKEHPRSTGKVGVMGFCLGGALSLAAGCHVEGLSAIVPFYGIPPAAKVDWSKVTAPILAHFGKNDGSIPVAKAEAVKAQLDALGKSMQLEIYDAGHAFVNDTRPEAYDEKSAKLAWQRSVDFLNKHLS